MNKLMIRRAMALMMTVALVFSGAIVFVSLGRGEMVMRYSDGAQMLRFTKNLEENFLDGNLFVDVLSDNAIILENTGSDRVYKSVQLTFPDMIGKYDTFFTTGSFRVHCNETGDWYNAEPLENKITISNLSIEEDEKIHMWVELLNVSTRLKGYLSNTFRIDATYQNTGGGASAWIRNIIGSARADGQGESGGDVPDNVEIAAETSDAATEINYQEVVVTGPSSSINQWKITNMGNTDINSLTITVENFLHQGDLTTEILVDDNMQVTCAGSTDPGTDLVTSDNQFQTTLTLTIPMLPGQFQLLQFTILSVATTQKSGTYLSGHDCTATSDTYGPSNLVEEDGQYISGDHLLATMRYRWKSDDTPATKLGYGTMSLGTVNDAETYIEIENYGNMEIDKIEIVLADMVGPADTIRFENSEFTDYDTPANTDTVDATGHAELTKTIAVGTTGLVTVDDVYVSSSTRPGAYTGSFTLIAWSGITQQEPPVGASYPSVVKRVFDSVMAENETYNQTFYGRSGTNGSECNIVITYNDFDDHLRWNGAVDEGDSSINSMIIRNDESFSVQNIIVDITPLQSKNSSIVPTFFVRYTNLGLGYDKERFDSDNGTIYIYNGGASVLGTGSETKMGMITYFVEDQDPDYRDNKSYTGGISIWIESMADDVYFVGDEEQNWTSSDYDYTYKLLLELEPEKATAYPGQVVTLDVTIHNKGDTAIVNCYLDTKWAYTVDDDDIESGKQIAGGKNHTVTFEITVPKTETGTEEIDVIANIPAESYTATEKFEIDISILSYFSANLVYMLLLAIVIIIAYLATKK